MVRSITRNVGWLVVKDLLFRSIACKGRSLIKWVVHHVDLVGCIYNVGYSSGTVTCEVGHVFSPVCCQVKTFVEVGCLLRPVARNLDHSSDRSLIKSVAL